MKNALSTGKNKIFCASALATHGGQRVESKRAATVRQHRATLNINANRSGAMSLIPDKPGVYPVQPLTDPMIAAARFLNEAAALDRALAMRKTLRPRRSDAARRGWEKRNG